MTGMKMCCNRDCPGGHDPQPTSRFGSYELNGARYLRYLCRICEAAARRERRRRKETP